jgi:hypothetical protein
MRRSVVLPASVAVGLVALVVNSSRSAAGSTNVDLSISGSVVAGVTGAHPAHHVPFSFTIRNRSANPADIAFTFTLTGGTAAAEDYVCPLVSTGFDIHPDTPSCEPGVLAGHHSTSAAIVVTSITTGTMTVQACASNLTGAPDPAPGNDCVSLSIPIS